MPKRYSLDAKVILRSEPQYYKTYAAFDYNKVRTELLTEDEYKILDHISAKSSNANVKSPKNQILTKKSARSFSIACQD